MFGPSFKGVSLIAGILFDWLLIVILVPLYGVTGAALASLAAYVTTGIIITWYYVGSYNEILEFHSSTKTDSGKSREFERRIESESERPNKAPEPTPGSVTPRATSGDSK